MRGDKFWPLMFVAMFILVAVSGVWQITEAVKCGEKGGVYLTGKSVWPVCLKVETL